MRKPTSAMFVDTITFRVPLSAGSKTASCSSVGSPACKASNLIFGADRGNLVKGSLISEYDGKNCELTDVGKYSDNSSRQRSISSRPVRKQEYRPQFAEIVIRAYFSTGHRRRDRGSYLHVYIPHSFRSLPDIVRCRFL